MNNAPGGDLRALSLRCLDRRAWRDGGMDGRRGSRQGNLGCRARDILSHADQGQIQIHESSWPPADNAAEPTEHEMSQT